MKISKANSFATHPSPKKESQSPKSRKPLYPFTDKKPKPKPVVLDLNFDSGSYSLFQIS